MPHIEERRAEVNAELERQNDEWNLTRGALAQLGDTPVVVPNAFLQQLEALAHFAAHSRPAIRA